MKLAILLPLTSKPPQHPSWPGSEEYKCHETRGSTLISGVKELAQSLLTDEDNNALLLGISCQSKCSSPLPHCLFTIRPDCLDYGHRPESVRHNNSSSFHNKAFEYQGTPDTPGARSYCT
jgi:hypothetical protein